MENESNANPGLFNKPLVDLLKPDWEKAVYLAIFVLAVVSRFWDLGARAMSHDESLHALYSYYLYNGSGYTHNPMMHGPFLFHANALIYFLFGDNDYTARIVPALFGVFMVMSPILLRRWLGRVGAAITSILLLISPLFVYYSRYIRNDIYIAVWTMLLIASLFHFLEDRKPKWFYLGASVLMLSLATKENAYIFGYLGLVFIIEVILWERISSRNQLWLYFGGAALTMVLLLGAVLLARVPAVEPDAEQANQVNQAVMKLLVSVVTVLAGTIPAVMLSASQLRSRHPRPSSVEEAFRVLSWQQWLIAAIVVFMVYTLLFTTFFTNPAGMASGIAGSISYWLAQQEVQRGGQPWYYYFLVLGMYEFVPFLFSMIALVYYLVRSLIGRPVGDHEEAAAAGDASRPEPEKEFEEARAQGKTATRSYPYLSEADGRFVAFLIFWTLATLFIYSWAGEKMPWLGVHPALPMIVLTGKFAGDLFQAVQWREVWQRGGAWLALLLPITLFGLYTLVKLQPFQGLSVFKLRETSSWLAALLVTMLLVVLTALAIRRLGGRYSFLVAVGTWLVFLSFFTIRFAYMASFINYDYATELLVYAHGGADVKPTMDEIAKISQRTVGDKMIEVAYDSDVSWPLEWYMREYPNRKFYGENPNREQLNVPIVLAGDKVDARVQPFLGDRYYRFKRRLVWWPNQQYMDLTWQRIRDLLTLPTKRQILWDILYYRKYPRTPDDWYHVHNMYLYIRKDVAQQIWDLGAAPATAVELPVDPYVQAHLDLSAELEWGTVGTEMGQFNHPRGLATGENGHVYVVDSDNHRVQVFDADGIALRQWGSNCNLATGLGCVDPDGDGPLEYGDGQFQEPWGIDVDTDGHVYVADTWNHRIQVFDSNGIFLTKWGQYGQTTEAVDLLYGPRDIAVDEAGRVFVSDTGNKRVLVFDRQGNMIDQLGGGGEGTGSFEEPVGIDIDSEGNLYVADTWNQRVQVFNSDLVFIRAWPVQGWYGESVVNKPYLALDAQGRVYLTDPEGFLVIVFSNSGDLLATFGQYGFDGSSFSLPTGIDLDAKGAIYVSDTDGQRVIRFEALPPVPGVR